MKQKPHIMLALSGHGYGHLAQCAPVINALWRRNPSLRLTVCSQLDEHVIAGRLDRSFRYHSLVTDPVLPMRSAWEVEETLVCTTYAGFYRHRHAGLEEDRALIDAVAPDLLLANIPWRMLTAARQAGVPGIALCSLNWAAVYERYCRDRPGSGPIAAQMWQSYRDAAVFLRPEPALPMAELGNTRSIGPIARTGKADRASLLGRLSLPEDARLVLVALGGVPSALPLANWPRPARTFWLFPGHVHSGREDMVSCKQLTAGFIDVLASCDAVLTKPGYGTCVEAVCNGIPILTLARPDWPETAGLNDWARRHGRLAEIGQADFFRGDFGSVPQRLWRLPPKPAPVPVGIEQAVEIISACL